MKRITSVMLAVLLIVVVLLSVACQQDPPQKFKVTFETFDGKSTVVEVVEGQTAKAPNNPSHTNAKFLGWCSDLETKTAWDSSAPIVADTIVYANWDYKYDVTITFESNNGQPSTTIVAHTGFLFATPADPVREHWDFAGWFFDKECTDKYDATKVLNRRGNFTMYAGWTVSASHTHDWKYSKTTNPTCEDIGYDTYTCVCGSSEPRNIVDPLGHDTEAGDDYMRIYTCDRCKKSVRKESLHTYDDVFKYEFSEEKAAEFDLLYQEILDILSSAERYSAEYARTWDATKEQYDTTKDVPGLYDENKAFEEKFNAYYDNILYVIEQYQYAYVFYCVNDGDSTYEAAYEYVTEYRTDMVKNFYSLYRLIHETKYREFFFAFDEGWTDEDIQSALVMSDSYGGEEYAEYNKIIEDIEVKIRALDIRDQAFGDLVPSLYPKYVDAYNQIAKLADPEKYNNYMDYAYDSIYGRDYTPADVVEMRKYVKQYITPLFELLENKLKESKPLNDNQKSYYAALNNASIFQNQLTADLVADYFELLHSDAGQAGKKEINFAKHANDLFKNKNYYTGAYEGAFSYFVRAQETAILYFGPGSYSGAFTFVHEFGHYYETVYNQGASISYDLEENHSQGNEMLFLAHLSKLLPELDCTPVFETMMYEKMYDAMTYILLATAVDEFEQIAYSGTYVGTNSTIAGLVSDGKIDASEYDKIYTALLKEYGGNTTMADDLYYYWRLAGVGSAGYYISYAMSQLPSLQLFVKGVKDFESAKQSYFKLFTFTDNEAFAEVDEFGDVVVTAGYAETLEYAGLYSPFQEELYIELKSYFDSL